MENSKTFKITRVFNAPRELVWKAHTEVEHLVNWWGPKGFKVTKARLDLQPGGLFHYGLEGPNGAAMWGKFVFREIVPQEKLTYVSSFSDPEGGTVRTEMLADWPLEILNTLTLEEADGKTILTLISYPIDANTAEEAAFAGLHSSMNDGFGGTYDQLEAHLEHLKTLQS